MSDKQQHDQFDPMMDTQRLLLGVDPAEGGDLDVDAILAEYGADKHLDTPAPPQEEPEKPVSPPAPPRTGRRGHSVIQFPAPKAPPETAPESGGPSAPTLRADNEIDGISPEKLFGLPLREDNVPLDPPPGDAAPTGGPGRNPVRAAEGRNTVPPDEEEELPAVSMEDIVASTVDAVKEEQERRQDKLRKKWEKARKKNAARPVKRKEPSLLHPLPDIKDEPPLKEAAARHKRRYQICRRSLLLSLPFLLLLWLPWLLTQLGVTVPFFSANTGNAALCVLIPQAIFCVLCAPVFRAALEGLREKACTVYFLAALSNVVTFLDEITLLFLPQRADVAPLGSVAALTAFFSLWGLTSYHRGMWETLRTASMGEPSYLVDCDDAGIIKGRGRLAGFYTRLNMEDTAFQWQRLLLPVLTAASLVFAVLASVGQEKGQDLLWCWSAILCASSSLVCPLVYCVPFGRLAVRLARNGAAVAGQYGAWALTASRRIIVTDADLFPQGTVALNGLKLYGEERNRAISYAATLAVCGGGCLGRIFGDICRGERIPYQPLEHFHVHDDNGLSGMIHGETVLVGPPVFMRHMAVRLPATLPSKTTVCLAVDGELTAVFAVKYDTSEPVESALRALGRNGLQLTLAVRDGNITPKLLKTRFGTDGGAVVPELSERLALSDPQREAEGPNGLLYREGLYPIVDMVAGSRRLCHVVRLGNLLTMLSSIFGALVGFYLTFTGSYGVLTPILLLTYLLLWVAPMVPLLWGVDKT